MKEELRREIKFTVFGNPQALKRHRTFRRGNFTGTYDPSKDDKDNFLLKAIGNKPDIPFDEPLALVIDCYFSRPRSHYGTGKNKDKLKDMAPLRHTSKPDIDNIVKFVFDALNGIFWKDDARICKIMANKEYADVPRIEIIIYH